MRVFLALVLVLTGCNLPQNVFYQCELDGGCAVRGTVCMRDGVCRPPDGGAATDAGTTDAGALDAGTIDAGTDAGTTDAGCVPRARDTACAAVECGFVRDGCGGEYDCDKRCPNALECGVRTANTCALPSLCTAAGWCWEHPLPQGLTLNAAFRLDARHTWFVGERNVILFFDGERSTLQTIEGLPPGELVAIHGTALDEVFAVGTNGLLLHFDGRQWEREGAAGFTSHLRAVWSVGGGRALAVGPTGKVLTRTPGLPASTRWTAESLSSTGSSTDLRAVVSTPDGRELFVTSNNQLFGRTNAMPWAPQGAVPLDTTTSAVPVSDGVVFGGARATGETVVKRKSDGTWQVLTDAGPQVTQLVRGDGGVFALGPPDFMWLAEDGSSVTQFESQSTQWNTGVALEGPRLFAAGRLGGMGVFSLDGGLSRTSAPLLRGLDLNAVCGVAPGALKAAGGADTNDPQQCLVSTGCRVSWLERSDTAAGVAWVTTYHHLGNTIDLHGCFAESADRAWLTGNDSKFLWWDSMGSHAGDFTGALRGDYTGAWGTPGARYFFTTPDSPFVTVSSDGLSAFSAMDVGVDAGLLSVWGFSANDVTVVGRGGHVARFDGMSWAVDSFFTDDLVSVHGAVLGNGTTRTVAVGGTRSLSLVTAVVPATTELPSDVSLRSVWVSRNGTAWAGGVADGGGVVFSSGVGAAWLPVPLELAREVRGVFGIDSPDGGASLWVVGPGGMVLRRELR